MATNKNHMRKDPFEDAAYLELAKTYLKMGQWEEALAQCRILVQHYKSLGMKSKATKMMALMARIDPSNAGPEKEVEGLTLPMKVKAREAANNRSEEAAIQEAFIDEKEKEAYFDLAAELKIVKSEETLDFNRKSQTNKDFCPGKNNQKNDKKRNLLLLSAGFFSSLAHSELILLQHIGSSMIRDPRFFVIMP